MAYAESVRFNAPRHGAPLARYTEQSYVLNRPYFFSATFLEMFDETDREMFQDTTIPLYVHLNYALSILSSEDENDEETPFYVRGRNALSKESEDFYIVCRHRLRSSWVETTAFRYQEKLRNFLTDKLLTEFGPIQFQFVDFGMMESFEDLDYAVNLFPEASVILGFKVDPANPRLLQIYHLSEINDSWVPLHLLLGINDWTDELIATLRAKNFGADNIQAALNSSHLSRTVVEDSITAASNRMMRQKAEYENTIHEYRSAMNFRGVWNENVKSILQNYEALKAYVDKHTVLEKAFVLVTNESEPEIQISITREPTILSPYNNADADKAIRDLVDEYNTYLRENYEPEQEYDEEMDEYYTPDDAEPENLFYTDDISSHLFQMPASIIEINVKLNRLFSYYGADINVYPLNEADGIEGYWGDGQAHPHAPGRHNGSEPCLGDYQVPVLDALSNFDFVSAAQLVDLFLYNYNQHDTAGCRVLNWPIYRNDEE